MKHSINPVHTSWPKMIPSFSCHLLSRIQLLNNEATMSGGLSFKLQYNADITF